MGVTQDQLTPSPKNLDGTGGGGIRVKLRLKPTSDLGQSVVKRDRFDGEASGRAAGYDVGTDANTGVLLAGCTIIDLPAKEGSMTPNIADIIRQHVSLEVSCIDRVYLHAYMPKLQTSGGLCYFLHDHLGHIRFPSPALFRPMHDRFVTAVEQFVEPAAAFPA